MNGLGKIIFPEKNFCDSLCGFQKYSLWNYILSPHPRAYRAQATIDIATIDFLKSFTYDM